jgi:predicted phage terminase large subunit-like protein
MKNSNELLAAAKYEKALRLARSDFWRFRLMMHKRLKVGWWHKQASYEIQQWWEDVLAGKRPKLLIEAPPQHGKSTLVSDLSLWIIGKSTELPDDHQLAQLKAIYAAFSDRLSTRANRYVQRYTKTKIYKDIFPNYTATKETQEAINFNLDGYFRNTTCGGAITGEAMDIGLLDDVMKGREEANSETIRNKKWDWLVSDFFTRFSECSGLIGIMTRWHVDDPFGRLLEQDPTVKELKYPAIALVDEPNRKKGEALFPEHKSLEFLNSIKNMMTTSIWEALYQQNPTISEGNFFKPDFIPITEIVPDIPRLQYVRAWDLAATANDGDYTVGVKMVYDSTSRISYIVDVVRGQYSPEDVEKIILTTAQNDGKQCKIRLPQDPGQAGKSQARNFVRLLQGFTVTAETVTGDKETRAGAIAAQANIGNVYMLRASWNRQFIDELRLFPNGVNDDQVDALSDAYNHCLNKKSGSF